MKSNDGMTLARAALRRKAAMAGLSAMLLALAAQAEPSVPWMPDTASRHDLELLVDEAHLDLLTTQWPLPSAAVRHALDGLPSALPEPLARARDRLTRALASEAQSRATLRLLSRGEALTGYGDDATRGPSAAVRTSTFDTAWVAGRVGLRVDSISGLQEHAKLRLDDTALVTEALGIELQAFSHRAWWGPGWQSSLTLGNNAPAFDGLGVQRASASRSESPWLAWLGPWNYAMFIAQTEDVSNPANPFFFAQRLTFKPWANLELAVTRTAQWGGRGREQSARSFLDLLTGRGTNADTTAEQRFDPANEEAGFDGRLRCPAGLHCAGYLQLTGEDRAGLWPSRYLGLYGFEWWPGDGGQRYFVEYAETGCRSPVGRPFLRGCAYRNYAYPEGYTNAGRWIGASVGPDSRLFTLGWVDAASQTSLRLSTGRVGSRIGTFTPDVIDPATSGRLVAVTAKTGVDLGAATLTPEFDWYHVAAPDGAVRQVRVGATLSMDLDAAFEGSSGRLRSGLSGWSSGDWQPLAIGAGLVAASALLDRTVDDYARNHAQNPSGRALGRIGKALPIGAFGLAAVSWAVQHDPAQTDLALSALEAGVSAGVVAEVAKFAVDRESPTSGAGPFAFGGGRRRDASFPSAHTAVAWAVLTPYAQYYQAPWLYGLAALTNAGRIASRDHWLSDTVAGSLVGYSLGDLFFNRSGASDGKKGLQAWLTPRSVQVLVSFD